MLFQCRYCGPQKSTWLWGKVQEWSMASSFWSSQLLTLSQLTRIKGWCMQREVCSYCCHTNAAAFLFFMQNYMSTMVSRLFSVKNLFMWSTSKRTLCSHFLDDLNHSLWPKAAILLLFFFFFIVLFLLETAELYSSPYVCLCSACCAHCCCCTHNY